MKRTETTGYAAIKSDKEAIKKFLDGHAIYTKMGGSNSGQYKRQYDLSYLVNNCYQHCTMYEEVTEVTWDEKWIEGGMYLCQTVYGNYEIKFYHNDLLWDKCTEGGSYLGNNLTDKFVIAIPLKRNSYI